MGQGCCYGKKSNIESVPQHHLPRSSTPRTPTPRTLTPRFSTPEPRTLRVLTAKPLTPLTPKPLTPLTPKPLTPKFAVPRSPSPPVKPGHPSKAFFTNPSIGTSNPLKLIEGYEKEPLLSLEEALDPLNGEIDHKSAYIREAKSKCYCPAKAKLTHDESAAIYIYTMKGDDGCLYDHLQNAWKSGNRSELRPWFRFLRLFRAALDKLPDVKEEIWQGTAFDETINEQFRSSPLKMYSAMGVCSATKKVVEEYLNHHGDSEKILLGFKSVHGKLVTDYSATTSSDIVIWPGMKLGLSNWEVIRATGSITFHMTGPAPPNPNPKTPIIEKHFVCCNQYGTYSIFIRFSSVVRNHMHFWW